MKKIFQQYREIIALVTYAAIVAVLVYFVILPLIGRIDSINNQIQEEAANQENIETQISQLPRIEQQYKTLQDNTDAIGILLDKDKAVILIEKLEKIADVTGNKITITVQDATLDPSAQKKIAAIKSKVNEETVLIDGLPSPNYLQLNIAIIGKYDSVIKFIKLLENFEYYNDIVSIQVGKNDSSAKAAYTQGMISVPTPNPFDASRGDGSSPDAPVPESDMLKETLNIVFYLNKSN